ncbi:zinc finger protein 600-like isoform X2 [Pieris rapae]|uniref:zinc finger protein 600-like isoform X2 n=1 Tax=Pieris rapae TaxID=64459 RepID=UPI001E27B2DD|nr:zinc finger protein 600-like isoform X2 [Pieris rapae]
MDEDVLYHHRNNTLSTLCRLCLEQAGATDIFQDCTLPGKISAIIGIKIDNLTPFPKKLCDNCYEIILLTTKFRESVIINDKQLHDFAKLYFSSEILNNTNDPVPEETRATGLSICNTQLEESHVSPIIRVRNDLFQNKVNNTGSHQTTNGICALISLEKQNEKACSAHQNCNSLNNNESISRASLETIIIDDEVVIGQRNDSPEIDGVTNNLYIHETANISDANESIDTVILEYDDSLQQSNVCQVLPMERVGNDLCIDTANESLKEDIENMSNTNCINKPNKHKNTSSKHNVQIKREIAYDQDDIKFSKRIKFEDGFEFNCDQCSKFFMSKKKLYCHKRVHNKKYVCEIAGCKKAFATKGDLQKHTRTHTGERPYECDLCQRKFKQKVLLKYHKGSIHGIKIKKTDEEIYGKI